MEEFQIFGVCGEAGHGKDLLADWLCGRYGCAKVSFADPMKRLVKQIFRFSDQALWGPSQARNKWYPWNWADSEALAKRVIPRMARELCPNNGTKELALTKALWSWYRWIMKTEAEKKSEEEGVTVRVMLQQLGTEYGRLVDPELWVGYAHEVVVPALKRGVGYDPKAGLSEIFPTSLGVVIPDHRFQNEIDYTNAKDGRVFRIRRLALLRKMEAVGIDRSHASEAEQRGVPDTAFEHVFEMEEGLLEALNTFGAYFSS